MGYSVPVVVQQTAKRALALRRQYGRGGTDVGLGTARRLARGGAVSLEFVKKVSEYFPRHAGDRLDDPTSNGSIAWGLWGGDAGRRWSEGVMAKAKKNSNPESAYQQVVAGDTFAPFFDGEKWNLRHIGVENPGKVVISQIVKRIASAGKFDGSEFKGKQVDPRVVEKQWKRQAVIHGVAEYGAPVQKLLRDEYESAFWQGAARGLASMANPKPKVTDRALRYRANANPPKGPKQCLWCNSKKNVEVGHLDGHEENNKPENLHWTCRSCNTALGAAFKKLGIGRRTRQYNPAGAETLGQWLNAVQSLKGESGGTMDLDAAVEMVRYTSPVKRSEFAREIWAKRRQAYGPTGRRNPAPDWFEVGRNAFNHTAKVGLNSSRSEGIGYLYSGDSRFTGARPLDDETVKSIAYYYYPVRAFEKSPVPSQREPRKRTNSPAWESMKHEMQRGWDSARDAMRAAFRRNPEEPAAELYEKFHGKPSERVEVIEEEVHYHEHLAGLGQLIELKVKTPTKIRATLRFGEGPEAPILSSSEDGRQLYIVGGDQKLDLQAIEMDGSEWRRDLMQIGEILEVTYLTEKKFHRFEPCNYFHRLGEETGVKPTLLYDTRNERMMIAGGQYHVKPEGIVN